MAVAPSASRRRIRSDMLVICREMSPSPSSTAAAGSARDTDRLLFTDLSTATRPLSFADPRAAAVGVLFTTATETEDPLAPFVLRAVLPCVFSGRFAGLKSPLADVCGVGGPLLLSTGASLALLKVFSFPVISGINGTAAFGVARKSPLGADTAEASVVDAWLTWSIDWRVAAARPRACQYIIRATTGNGNYEPHTHLREFSPHRALGLRSGAHQLQVAA